MFLLNTCEESEELAIDSKDLGKRLCGALKPALDNTEYGLIVWLNCMGGPWLDGAA